MATVILARHGRTSANTGGILAGRTPGVRLDDLGVTQAQAAGERLAGLALNAIVTSPLERCRQTATIIGKAQERQIRPRSDKDLAEVDYGQWQGRPLKELAKEPLWRTVQQHPAGVVFPDGESLAGMSRRAVGAVRRWDALMETEHGPDAVWLVSSHGDPIKAILADALGMHLDAFQRIMIEPGSLSVIRYTPDRPFVVAMNTRAGDLSELRSKPRSKGRRSDAVVGGGA